MTKALDSIYGWNICRLLLVTTISILISTGSCFADDSGMQTQPGTSQVSGQSQPVANPDSAQSPPSANPDSTQSQPSANPDSAQSQPGANPNSAQLQPGANPDSAQSPAAPSASLSTFPHGFVHIKLEEPMARWYFFPTGTVPIKFSQQQYGFNIAAVSGTPMLNGGVLCSVVEPCSVRLGIELTARALDGIIFSSMLKDKSAVENKLINAINQMVGKPDAIKTAADLHNVLGNPITIASLAAGDRDFYLFSPDGQHLQVMPTSQGKASCSWMEQQISNSPDGKAQLDAEVHSPAPENVGIPVVTPSPSCLLTQSLCWMVLNQKLYWTPGSGSNGCLGLLRIENGTDIYTHAVCSPF